MNTQLPPEVVDYYCSPKHLKQASVAAGPTNARSSFIAWEASSNWLASLVETYMRNMNTLYFHYDLTNMEDAKVQYTVYNEGDYYSWHIDADINSVYSNNNMPVFPDDTSGSYLQQQQSHIRKLSFTLQLSHPEEYTGGELQFNMEQQSKLITVPKKYGMLTVFDSRISHRVRKVKTGQRKSLVGWMCGPRWK